AAALNEPDLPGSQHPSRIQLWETASGLPGSCLQVDKTVRGLAFAPDSRVLAAGCEGGAIRLWDMNTFQERCCFKGHRADVCALASSRDATGLARGSDDPTGLVWEVPAPPRPKLARADNPKPDMLWKDLGSTDAAKAHRALWLLVQSPPGPTLAFLRQRLR